MSDLCETIPAKRDHHLVTIEETTMTIYTIPRKMSGTGSIHDLASELGDREIRFAGAARYAVVLAAYYGGRGYTTHESASAAAAESHSRRGYSHKIIDCEGNKYVADRGELRADGVLTESCNNAAADKRKRAADLRAKAAGVAA